MLKITTAAACLLLTPGSHADVVESSTTHYVLSHESRSALSPAALWERLVQPASWWHPEHTYSGDAANLSLDLRPGGLWQEYWEGGAVAHGEVLMVIEGSTLRLNAPFGPLQGVGAYTVWTISIEADGDGSVVRFAETATGPASAQLDELAPAVDYVKTEAIRRLTGDQRAESGP